MALFVSCCQTCKYLKHDAAQILRPVHPYFKGPRAANIESMDSLYWDLGITQIAKTSLSLLRVFSSTTPYINQSFFILPSVDRELERLLRSTADACGVDPQGGKRPVFDSRYKSKNTILESTLQPDVDWPFGSSWYVNSLCSFNITWFSGFVECGVLSLFYTLFPNKRMRRSTGVCSKDKLPDMECRAIHFDQRSSEEIQGYFEDADAVHGDAKR